MSGVGGNSTGAAGEPPDRVAMAAATLSDRARNRAVRWYSEFSRSEIDCRSLRAMVGLRITTIRSLDALFRRCGRSFLSRPLWPVGDRVHGGYLASSALLPRDRSMGQSVPPCKTPKRPCAIQAHLRVKAYCVANSEASSAASAESARPHRLHSKSLNSELPF
jgi:hypothetical protein